jgi:hypothetical protein
MTNSGNHYEGLRDLLMCGREALDAGSVAQFDRSMDSLIELFKVSICCEISACGLGTGALRMKEWSVARLKGTAAAHFDGWNSGLIGLHNAIAHFDGDKCKGDGQAVAFVRTYVRGALLEERVELASCFTLPRGANPEDERYRETFYPQSIEGRLEGRHGEGDALSEIIKDPKALDMDGLLAGIDLKANVGEILALHKHAAALLYEFADVDLKKMAVGEEQMRKIEESLAVPDDCCLDRTDFGGLLSDLRELYLGEASGEEPGVGW